MMKEQLIREICTQMSEKLTENQMNELQEALIISFAHVRIESATPEEAARENSDYLNMYLSAKRIEGCSDKTLEYYGATVKKLFNHVIKNVKEINTEDIRAFLAAHQKLNNANKVTMDNIRRIVSGFFSWLEDENCCGQAFL